MLGADGVVVGTRFWSSAEALTPTAATDRAARATGDDTIRTKAVDALRGVPWPEEFSFRMVKNRLTDEWAHRQREAREAYGTLAETYAAARNREDFDVIAVVAGEAVGLVQDRPGAEEIVQRMAAEARRLLSVGGSLDLRRA
jgi:nitronate monooxygenase